MRYKTLTLTLAIAAIGLTLTSCIEEEKTASGSVTRKIVDVATDENGWTTEQKNVAARLKIDNQPGSIKHLYIISPYSGQTILYSTVKGKVTSSGKRLTPNTVSGKYVGGAYYDGVAVNINGVECRTTEVLQDDGSYGSSCEYVYWFDARDEYHQHFFTGGQIIHVSTQPMPVKNITINLEQQ